MTFNSEAEALDSLSSRRFHITKNNTISPKQYDLSETEEETAAINYLLLEHEYDYDNDF